MGKDDAQICVIANPASGTVARNPDALTRAMEVFGTAAELRPFKGDPAKTAEAAAREGFKIIVAAGGDGTVAGVAHALAGTDAALAVLPLGTFNYFARGLAMPEDPALAAAAILQGAPHPIKVGTLNGRVFLNNVAIGLYPAILEEREAAYARWGRSRLLAHLASLRTILRFQKPHRMRLKLDDTEQLIRTPMLFVARSAYQLDQFGLNGGEAISDDRFALFLAPQQTRLGFLRLALRLISKRVDHGRDVMVATPARIEVQIPRRRRISVALDGEQLTMQLPLEIALAPDRLQVILPPQKAGQMGGSEAAV
ncbi:diacylglycerol kinase family protein [Xinfangfangia sp. CPCC 101601]|uniref:Diacylglycerol kinase family protein n=1 Tax=Pseudogemmobacter lacusdianii TaxID=3069608 RepID=A0ABU0VV41_9RHOB|nr:diacylglycerol kinase family protein [Xinfangfangia sp. CPCC 101601]MDQ2065592.1 diacylglycerol kinase family protein [Xinfangfangia sp. CPCC 101601]